MKAIAYKEYGPPDVLKLTEVEKPAPKENELLIKIHAVSVNFGDIIARNFKGISPRKFHMPFVFWIFARMHFGFMKPKIQILGNEFSGEVEDLGKDVKRFKKGDEVFGTCGMSMGAYSEYLCASEDGLVALKPTNMTHEEAAAVPGGAITALNLLEKVNVRKGQKVLINGASGGIGSAAVQLAKYFGAEVTGVCGTPRLEYVRSLGAEKVIDYTKEDFTQNGETYDLIFDILGKGSFSRCKNSLKQNGRYLLASFKLKQLFQMLRTSIMGGKKVICALSSEKSENLIFIKSLVESGIIKSIIDRRFPLERTADAHRYVEEGHKKGSVVIILKGNRNSRYIGKK